MTIFDGLSLLGGLCLFLFGMSLMGTGLEKRAGSGLKTILSRLTTGKMKGLLTGLAVTAVIQSSSATTVMVVGFVNSGLMTLRQAINVIMGANIGTTATAWILSMTGISSQNLWVQMLKPSSFTPILALVGIIFYMMSKNSKRKDTGLILLGFSLLMFGMDSMSAAVSGLRDVPEFQNLLLLFSNPILGVLAGAILTAIIQSSSASVGILQAVVTTGQVTFGSAIPIIMGQNIGTCVTALLSCVGTNKNAKRAAVVHLSFNVVGTLVCLTLFCVANAIFKFAFVHETISQVGIAAVHSTFNLLCTALLLPMSSQLEKLSRLIVPDGKEAETIPMLDERLMATPTIAVERCRVLTESMASISFKGIQSALKELRVYNAQDAEMIRQYEKDADRYEDLLGTYLVKLSAHDMTEKDSTEAAELLHMIGDLERISDHGVNVLESAEEIREKNIQFSDAAWRELSVITAAVEEILDLSLTAFLHDDIKTAALVEPLEQVVDTLKDQLRSRHILRLQKGSCSIEAGFVWSDLLTNLERVADHCSNIAGCVIETTHESLDLHKYLSEIKTGNPEFMERYNVYARKYALMEAE
ncbi:MAG: Na/Pi cotransporter family protein [Oscillibacter sp.]|nr:Na/Pi cotransporter family protein [Oscillibacter sp.]